MTVEQYVTRAGTGVRARHGGPVLRFEPVGGTAGCPAVVPDAPVTCRTGPDGGAALAFAAEEALHRNVPLVVVPRGGERDRAARRWTGPVAPEHGFGPPVELDAPPSRGLLVVDTARGADVELRAGRPVARIPSPVRATGPVVLALVPWTPAAAVSTAVETALRHGAPLSVVRTWVGAAPDLGRVAPAVLDEWDAVVARLHREIEHVLAPHRRRSPGLRTHALVVRDELTRFLADLAGGARLIVTGCSYGPDTPPGVSSRGLGIMAAIEAPVLVVPHDPAPGAA